VREAGPNGVKLDPRTEQKNTSALEPGELTEFRGITRTDFLARTERELRSNLLRRSDVAPDKRLDFVLRLLAQAQIEATFERIYRLIFGSQISGLRELNARRQVTLAEAKQFYDGVAKQYPQVYPKYSFEEWLGFLRSQGLVSANDGKVIMTDMADDFLLYLITRHLPENKNF
jgi:hypothetical protein